MFEWFVIAFEVVVGVLLAWLVWRLERLEVVVGFILYRLGIGEDKEDGED